MFDWFEKIGLQDLTVWSILLRMFLATMFGGILGLERSKKRRAAGFRTYMLVCLSACVIMMTGQYMHDRLGGTDTARLGAQVISGIGFLGAGSILVTGTRQIKGLTTAAGLWSCACLGIAIGIGFYFGAVLMAVTMVLVMTIFNFVEVKYIARSKSIHVYVVLECLSNISDFIEIAEKNDIIIDNYETARAEFTPGIGVFFKLRSEQRRPHKEIMELIRPCAGLTFMEEL